MKPLLTTWEELEELKKQGAAENPTLDFKKDIPSNEKVSKTICAFANATGGLIIFGAEYDDQKTRKLTGFPGVSLMPNLDSRMEQIAMNLRPRVAIEFSKPITIPSEKDKVVYALLVHPGQLQPHQMEDGRFMVRYGTQSGALPENIIEQMYLARAEYGKKAEEIIKSANYGLPESIKLYNSESYWTALSLMPIHFRKDLVMNSESLRNLLNESLPVELRTLDPWRETHFGYRLIFPRQEVEQPLPKEYHYLIEVHNNGLIILSDMFEITGPQGQPKNFVSANHVLKTCSKAFQFSAGIYTYAKYGGFLKCYLSLKSIYNKYLVFHRDRGYDKSPYPYESEDGGLQMQSDCSVVDLNGSDHFENFKLKLRQSFGLRTP